MKLVEHVIATKIALGCADRFEALCDIKRSIDSTSLWQAAKTFNVLRDNSAEDFAIEFFSAYNAEIAQIY
jgi:hypothetical protein